MIAGAARPISGKVSLRARGQVVRFEWSFTRIRVEIVNLRVRRRGLVAKSRGTDLRIRGEQARIRGTTERIKGLSRRKKLGTRSRPVPNRLELHIVQPTSLLSYVLYPVFLTLILY